MTRLTPGTATASRSLTRGEVEIGGPRRPVHGMVMATEASEWMITDLVDRSDAEIPGQEAAAFVGMIVVASCQVADPPRSASLTLSAAPSLVQGTLPSALNP